MGGLQATRVPALPGVVAGDGARVPWKAEALARLPEGPADTDPFWRLAAAFLVAYPDSTAKAYLGDLKAWAAECESKGLHPFAARRHHVDAWVKALARDPQPATGRPASAATIARRLSCLSKFYDYGMREVELIEHSPVANVRRPKVSEDSPTIGLDAAELDRLLTAAEADGTTSAASSPSWSTTACASTRHCAATSRTSPTNGATECCASPARVAGPRPSRSLPS